MTKLIALTSTILLMMKQVYHPTAHQVALWLNMKRNRPNPLIKMMMMIVPLPFGRDTNTNVREPSSNYEKLSLKIHSISPGKYRNFFLLVSAKAFQRF